MAILAPLLAYVGRFIGKLVQMAFGWATILLFGRVPQSRQLLLSFVAFGSILWLAVLVGVVFVDVGTLLVAAVPAPDAVSDTWIRIGMLVAAILLPIAVGVAGLFLTRPDDRPATLRGRLIQVLRGYPYALALALILILMTVVAPIRRVRSLLKGWEDAHIPILVKPGGYERVADDIEAALDGAGLPIERAKAPIVLEAPSRLLALVGGGSVRQMVPDRLLVLQNRDLEVTIHPSDVAMAGKKAHVAQSRAAIASTLTFTEAYLTTERESQEIEDALVAIAQQPPDDAARELEAIDERLARLVVPHDDWEVLYRLRLQVERSVHRRVDARRGPLDRVGELVGQILR